MRKHKGISYEITDYNLSINVDLYKDEEEIDSFELDKTTFIGEQDIDQIIKEYINENY